MATIEKRGETYRIRVSAGYDANGKQLMKSKTWKPAPGMTKRQIEKELERQQVLFEEQVRSGQYSNSSVKFEPFARAWLEQAEREGIMKPLTLKRWKQCQERTYKAIGHLKVGQITTVQLQKFINNLTEDGVRSDTKYRAKVDLKTLLQAQNMTQKTFSASSDVSYHVIQTASQGKNIAEQSAKKISKALGKPLRDVFEPQAQRSGALSTKTQKLYLCFISDVFQYAIRCGLITRNPCHGVQAINTPSKERDVYTLDEAQQFLDRLQSAPIQYRAFFTLAIFGGFRRGELLGLEWSDIDFKNCTISIQRTSLYAKEQGGTFTGTPKTAGSVRTLKVPRAVIDLLREYRKEQTSERLKVGDQWINSNRLFTQWNGAPMSPDAVRHWLERFCKREGLRYVNVHSFRHLNASLLISSGADVKTVSSALGHSQATTTLNIYAHSFAEAQARASEAIADVLNLSIADTKKQA